MGWSRSIALSARGITLFEALIAILLMSSAAAWALQTNVMALRAASQSYTELLAIKGVQEYYMEYLRSQPFASVTLQNNQSFSTPTLDAGDLPGGQGRYWVELEEGKLQLKRVTVKVDWTDPGNRARSSSVSTLISQGGISN